MFEPFEKIQIVKPKSTQQHKKTSNILIFHYGSINLDIKTFSKSVPEYAKKHKYDYINITDISVWQNLYSLFQTFKYEYILMIPTNVYVKNTQRKLETILQQAGDVDMILSRSESPDQLNMDVILFRNSEWTHYKIHQFYYHEQELDTDIILDQIYTDHQHKTLREFREYLDLGIPYILSMICVFNEHTLASRTSDFMRYYDRITKKESKQVEKNFPWGTIEHPKLVMIPHEPKPKDIKPKPKTGDSKIPKLIFQTMETNLTMVNIKACMDQIQEHNPDYTYYYYNAYECRMFIQQHFPNNVLEAYDTLLPGAYKADLWRYCVLYIHGGFYMDCRMYPYASFDSIITNKTEFMTCIDVTPNMAYQAILGSVPKSPVLKYAIDKCVENIQNRRKNTGDLGVTGPKIIGMAINHWLKRTIHEHLTKIQDERISLLQWNSIRSPKYLQLGKDIFCCHKYTKLLSNEEVDDETRHWMMLTGKQHYSIYYRKGNVYKFPLLK
jgi:mannosyltransferase OCH1-like enzyme